MSIARWLLVAGLLAAFGCTNSTGPVQDCTMLDNGAASVSNGAPVGMVCTPQQAPLPGF